MLDNCQRGLLGDNIKRLHYSTCGHIKHYTCGYREQVLQGSSGMQKGKLQTRL